MAEVVERLCDVTRRAELEACEVDQDALGEGLVHVERTTGVLGVSPAGDVVSDGFDTGAARQPIGILRGVAAARRKPPRLAPGAAFSLSCGNGPRLALAVVSSKARSDAGS